MPVTRYAGYYIGFLCEPQDPCYIWAALLRPIATLTTTATILRQGSSTARRSKGRPTGSLPTRRQPRRAAALTPSSPTRWTATAGCAASANPSSPTARTAAPPSGSTVRAPSAPSAQPCQQFGVASLTLCGVFADATSMVSLGNGSIRVVSAAGPCTHGTGYTPGGRNLPGCNTSILTYSLRKHGFMCVTKDGAGVAQKALFAFNARIH